MKKFVILGYLLGLGMSQNMATAQTIASGVNDSLLIVHLRSNYYPSTPRNYNAARDSMYQYLDVDETDSLTCVYSGLRAKRDGTRTPANGALEFNTEHSWPQSFYNEAEPMRGDIHHLFPTWSSPNQSRSNHPFAEVDDNNTTSWWYWENGGSVSSIPTSNIDLYSEYYNDTFEPREDHKGNVARAMFYFWTMYATDSDVVNDESDNEAFFEGMKQTLYDWHLADPVDADELARSEGIESIQGNRNPFIHDTSLVRRAYFYTASSSDSTLPELYISEMYEANGGTIKYLELYNPTDSTIDLSSDDWALLRFSNAGTSPSSISLTGTVASKTFHVAGDDNASSGVQTIFGEGIVRTDNSSVNHNGNDKYALVKYASTSADTIDWFGKDNVGNSSNFAQNQVLYRRYDQLPNDGSIGQTTNASDGDTTSSGYWIAYDVTSSNGNGTLVGTPGYNKGIEADTKPEALLIGDAGWRLISIPADQSTLSMIEDDLALQGVSDSDDANVFTYSSTGAYQTPGSVSETLGNGEGLVVYVFDNNQAGSSPLPLVLDTDGTEPSGDVSVTLNTQTAVSGSYFTLVGNPFQQAITLSSITSDQTLQTNVHILNEGLYSPVASSSAIMHPWQGFWVESGTANPATTLTFPQSGKTDQVGTVRAFSKVARSQADLQVQIQSSGGVDFGCRIEFRADADRDWDRFDSSKLQPARPDYGILSCLSDQGSQAILSLPDTLAGPFQVPLNLEATGVADEFSLLFSGASVFDAYSVQLSDSETGLMTDLASDDQYDFIAPSHDAQPGTSPGRLKATVSQTEPRFLLTLTPRNLVSTETDTNPEYIRLFQNYPNPFNPTTVFAFAIPSNGLVRLSLYSVSGAEVATITNRRFTAGQHSVSFDGTHLSSGIYFARMELIMDNGISETRNLKVSLLK
ncbi:MAG: endonuclease [Bacteroidota bacterium]